MGSAPVCTRDNPKVQRNYGLKLKITRKTRKLEGEGFMAFVHLCRLLKNTFFNLII